MVNGLLVALAVFNYVMLISKALPSYSTAAWTPAQLLTLILLAGNRWKSNKSSVKISNLYWDVWILNTIEYYKR